MNKWKRFNLDVFHGALPVSLSMTSPMWLKKLMSRFLP